LADPTIFVMDDQFGFLIPADITSQINRLGLGRTMSAGTLGAVTLDIPTTLRIRNYMMLLCFALAHSFSSRQPHHILLIFFVHQNPSWWLNTQ